MMVCLKYSTPETLAAQRPKQKESYRLYGRQHGTADAGVIAVRYNQTLTAKRTVPALWWEHGIAHDGCGTVLHALSPVCMLRR